MLADALVSLPRRFGRIGAEMGPEMVLRMPAADFLRIGEIITPRAFVDGTAVLRALRGIKSAAEIDKIRHVCQLTSDAFLALPAKLQVSSRGAYSASI